MKSVRDKQQETKARVEAEKQLALQATAALRRQELDEKTLKCSFCFLLKRLSGRVDVVSSVYGNGTSAVGSKAVFGTRRVSADAKLLAASEKLSVHLEQLESRAESHESDTRQLLKEGKKAEALRALKKAKMVRARIAQVQSAADALEMQLDALEGAALNQSLSLALKQSNKSMKKHKKLLNTAEDAVDQASETRDLARDLEQVMADFGATANEIDEEDLMQELEGMLDADPPPPTSAPAAVDAAPLSMPSVPSVGAVNALRVPTQLPLFAASG